MKDFKETVGHNLTQLRIRSQLTQLDVAKKLNYTDKSISKWEHGDAMPSIDILAELADMYGVTLDYLVSNEPDQIKDKLYTDKRNNPNKIIIACLAVLLVWLIAVIGYVYLNVIFNKNVWVLFVCAVPTSAVVLIVFNSIWGKRVFKFILVSLLIWSLLAALFFLFIQSGYNIWTVFILGVPLQIAVILWSKMKKS